MLMLLDMISMIFRMFPSNLWIISIMWLDWSIDKYYTIKNQTQYLYLIYTNSGLIKLTQQVRVRQR